MSSGDELSCTLKVTAMGVFRPIKAPKMRAMLTLPLARWGAFFWGAVVFLPVGANYTAMLLTCVAMGMQGKLDQRARRIRASPYWWPGLVLSLIHISEPTRPY